MTTGVVKWFNLQKGYGFIQRSDKPNNDVFVHISALQEAGIHILNEGDKVSFDLSESKGKISATNLKLLNN
ncbi:Cold shock protein CspC [Rickettsiales bacterium Ac37b]|nr:Cold shock protein CspC [Rickettsiales bacterium Ac37b]